MIPNRATHHSCSMESIFWKLFVKSRVKHQDSIAGVLLRALRNFQNTYENLDDSFCNRHLLNVKTVLKDSADCLQVLNDGKTEKKVSKQIYAKSQL